MSQDEVAVNDQAVQEPAATDSAPVETKTPDVADSFDKVWEVEPPESKEETDSPETAEEQADADEPSEAEETPPEQPATKADERKQQLNTEIRDLVAQRNSLKTEVERMNAEAYQAPSVEDLVSEGMDETRAMVESMRQQQEIDKYNSQVVDAQLTLESESSRVLREFPMFDPKPNAEGQPTNPDYKPEVAQKAAELLQQNLILDPNTGQVIGSHISPYKLYETIASAHQVSAVENQLKGQQATEKMLANADLPSNAAPPKQKADAILEIWKD